MAEIRTLFDDYYELASEGMRQLIQEEKLPPSLSELPQREKALREQLDRVRAYEDQLIEQSLAALAEPRFPWQYFVSLVAAAGAAVCAIAAIALVAGLDTSGQQAARR